MVYRDFLPSGDEPLRAWATAFCNNLVARSQGVGGPGEGEGGLGVSLQEALNCRAVCEAYSEALRVARGNTTRSPSAVVEKDSAKRLMVRQVRAVVRRVQAWPGTSDTDRVALGITIRERGGRHRLYPRPVRAPEVRIDGVLGWRLRVSVLDPERPARRPREVQGAILYYFVGDDRPDNLLRWVGEMMTNRRRYEMVLDNRVPVGATVWVTARWFNGQGAGPVAEPRMARVNYVRAYPELRLLGPRR